MKNNKNEIDNLIRESLNAEEAEFYDSLDEQSLQEMLTGLFQGRQKWFMVLTMIAMLGLFVAGIFCAIQFFEAENTKELIGWSIGFIFFMLGSWSIKVFHWMQIEKNAMLREMKRLELQITALGGKISKGE